MTQLEERQLPLLVTVIGEQQVLAPAPRAAGAGVPEVRRAPQAEQVLTGVAAGIGGGQVDRGLRATSIDELRGCPDQVGHVGRRLELEGAPDGILDQVGRVLELDRKVTGVLAEDRHLLLALERAGPEVTTEGLVKALEGITDYTDIFGYRVSFGPDKHSGATESVLSQVQNGRWVKLEQAITY